jgi:type IV pilus assembly protein PilE
MAIKQKYNRGFTLIELMVVILIIAILATLATVAGSAAIRSAKQTRIKLELDNMAGQIDQYKADYGSYPPHTTPLLRQHLQQKFSRALPGDLQTLPDNLTPAEVLWVCLRGWTNDPQRPVDFFNPSARRTKTFGFEEGRLRQMRIWPHNQQKMTPLGNGWPSQVAVYSYTPQVGKASDQAAPYVYFDCSRSYTGAQFIANFEDNPPWTFDDKHGVAFPYMKGTNVVNAGKYQLVAAGLDDHFGLFTFGDPTQDVNARKLYPDGVRYTPEDNDNLVNFSGNNLEDSKP